MNNTNLIGMLAAFISTAAFLPQVIKAHISRETKDISLMMYAVLSVGLVFWLVYGVMLGAMPVIAANGIVLIFTLYIVILKIKYG